VGGLRDSHFAFAVRLQNLGAMVSDNLGELVLLARVEGQSV
jgi:hypothetical protein